MFLVGKDILCGLNEKEYIKRNGSKVIISIPNSGGKAEVFSFDNFPINSLDRENVLLKNVSVTISDNKTCIKSGKSEPGTVYALLRIVNCVPDDVFINKKHLSYIKLIKKISYISTEVDYGSYNANVYFVKISLTPDAILPIYFAYDESYFLEEHIAFYCDDNMKITFKDNLKTFTLNDSAFMSLSQLKAN